MAMQGQMNATPIAYRRVPWNKGKLTGPKPPLRPKHVWSIRTKRRVRDLAMFNLAIDSELRGCDVVAVRVEDVVASGCTADRATVRQKKTGRPVRFELSEQTRQAIDDYLKAANKRPGEFFFTGRRGSESSMTTCQYARLVSEWIGGVRLDPRLFGTYERELGYLSAAPSMKNARQKFYAKGSYRLAAVAPQIKRVSARLIRCVLFLATEFRVRKAVSFVSAHSAFLQCT
jgi:hypothetical protein